jgi:Asp/Glu/hydantoin racemase
LAIRFIKPAPAATSFDLSSVLLGNLWSDLMKIVVINPNTSLEATDVIAKEAARSAGAQIEIVTRTAPRGPLNIGSVAESTAQAPVVVEMLEQESMFDGAIIAAYSDPGLELARKRMTIPIVGIGESSMKEAARLGSRIVIVSSNQNNEPLYLDCAAKAGVTDKLVAIRYLPKEGRTVLDVLSDRAWLVVNAIDVSRAAIEHDAADVIVIAGGPLAGVARDVKQALNFPVLDPVACAVTRLEAWVRSWQARPVRE